MQNLLTETSTSFKSELQQKQSLIDQTHLALREATSLLADERRRLASLEQKATTRNHLRQQCANLRRANALHRAEFARNGAPGALKEDVKIGEADAGLQIDASLFNSSTDPENLTPQQIAALAAMPSTAVLQARKEAYQVTNMRLEQQKTQLKSQSFELEAQMRRIVSLCTGVEEGKVDEMLEGLQAAVESERGGEVDVGRVREFLRRVERGGE
jgi:regulatory protein SWI6